MYEILILFIILVIFVCIFPNGYEKFEQVKIKLKTNPINFNISNTNNCGDGCSGNNSPDVIVPVYAPWKTYWPANLLYPYYPFYPFYYNNYFLP